MRDVYTITQLKEAWASYSTDKVMRVQKGGKWYSVPTGTKLEGDVTGARVETYSNVMSFIRYLEKYYG